MVQDLSHTKIVPPANQPYRGLGSPWATGSDPQQMANVFKLGPVKTAAESAAEVAAAKAAAQAAQEPGAQAEVTTDAGLQQSPDLGDGA